MGVTKDSGNATNNAQKLKPSQKKVVKLPSVEAIESAVPWHVESNQRVGRHAVANEDIEIGTLLLVEHPVVTVPLPRNATFMCHRCFRQLEAPAAADKDRTSTANPCLPRFCTTCKSSDPYCEPKIQNALAPMRINLVNIASDNNMDPTLPHLITLLDLHRAGVFGDAANADVFRVSDPNIKSKTVHCTIADSDLLPAMWEKKDEQWRKRLSSLTRALHKELKSLADSGKLPGYQPSSIQQLQADAAMLTVQLQPVFNDNAYALFPAMTLFQHSCSPNCTFIAIGGMMYIRSINPIAKGDALTVSYVNLLEPREMRQQHLQMERHLACACPRCVQPIENSVDKYLEGLWCSSCEDIMVALKPGPENDEAAKKWQELIEKEEKALAIRRAKLAKAKKGGAKTTTAAAKEEAKEEAESSEKKEEGNEDNAVSTTTIPPDTLFWRCCGCGAIEPAHTVGKTAPGDIVAQAEKAYQQGLVFMRTGHPQLIAQAEESLALVAGGMKGRMPIYNHKVAEALTPLINMNIRKPDPMKVITYSLQLYQIERDVLQFSTFTQLQCLDVMIDAAEMKATNANSSIIKKQFEKKLKLARAERKILRQQLLGK